MVPPDVAASVLELAEYGQWVIVMAVVVWLMRSQLSVVAENTEAIRSLGSVVEKVNTSVVSHEQNTVAARGSVEATHAATQRIESTVADIDRVVRDMLPYVQDDGK